MKKIITLCAVGYMCISLTACGNQTELPQTPEIIVEAPTEETIENTTDAMGNTYAVPKDANVNPYAEAYVEGVLMQAGELWFMSAANFENWCKEHYPLIAEHLGVSWEEVNWPLAQKIMYKKIFGSKYPEWAEDAETAASFGAVIAKTPEEIEQEKFDTYAPNFEDPYVLYFTPPKGFIAAKTTDEKRSYLRTMMDYIYSSAEAETMKLGIDAFNDEQVEEMAAEMAETIEVEYPYYTYQPGDEFRKKSNQDNLVTEVTAESQEQESLENQLP